MRLSALPLVLFFATFVACAASTGDGDDADVSEDDLVATFDRRGSIDVKKTSRVILVGDSDELGELPLWAATTKARRYVQLYPNDQIVLFVTKDVRDSTVAKTGASVVHQDANLTLSDLSRLSSDKLVAALHRFERIASIDFFGHSSPFGALLEAGGDGRSLGPSASIGILKSNFARDTHPYVVFNGCNGGANVAPQLSKAWEVPVAGALTGTNFQALMSDGRWYYNDKGFYPEGLTPAKCRAGDCIRMKPQDSPYRGVWADTTTGFQYGLDYYKFFCDYADPDGTCAMGMATSLYAFPSTKNIDHASSDADVKDVLADFFCSGNADATWFDTCKTNLLAAAASHAPFSPMKSANDYSLECDFAKCEQKFRCKTDANGAPQYHSCVWVSATCAPNASNASCRPKNTVKQTTNNEIARYMEGHRALRGF